MASGRREDVTINDSDDFTDRKIDVGLGVGFQVKGKVER